MKNILLLFLLLSCLVSKANEIDSLKTDEDVISFVNKYAKPSNMDSIEIPSKAHVYKSEDRKDTFEYQMDKRLCSVTDGVFWYKTDLNNDGFTDLVVTVSEKSKFNTAVLVIFANKDNSYSVKQIARFIFYNNVAKVLKINEIPCILISSIIPNHAINDSCPLFTDTLSYAFNDFIEYNPSIKKHTIEKLVLHEYWSLRRFDISLYFTTKEIFYSINMLTKEGFDSTVSKYGFVTEKKVSQIEELLNYIGFTSLQDIPEFNGSIHREGDLKIIYDNNKIKTIQDYGLCRSYGLQLLYKLLEDLTLEVLSPKNL